MSQPNEDFLFGAPTKEEDEPIDPSQLEQIDPLTAVKLKIDNNDKRRKDRRYYSAFRLIVGCLIMLGIIYLIDVGMTAWLKGESSAITTDIIEIVKTVLFTLSGYLFAKRENLE